MRVLVIEDNSDIAECMTESLSHMGIASDWFTEGRYLESAVAVASFDLVILDLNLPDCDGLSVLKAFREKGNTIPILIVSARISVESRVAGLDLGGDDYLVKPFSLDEFEARIRSLLRRGSFTKSAMLKFGDLSFNQSTREFFLKGEGFDFSPRERAVLEILIQKGGDIISKQNIANHIFNFDDSADVSSIEIYIHRLRKKLANSNVNILTRRGLGYILVLDEAEYI